jgi:hypothetical protein
MKSFAFRTATGVVLLGLLASLTVFGQKPPQTGALPPRPTALTDTRDKFGPNDNLQSRLKPEDLERATREDRDMDAERPAKPPAAAVARPPTASALPAHRASRDSSLKPLAAHHGSTAAPIWQITLRNSFIEKYKNRATLSTPFRVLFHNFHKIPEDGDAHVAGLTEEVGLACVAEIMNVADRADAQNQVIALQKSSELVPVTGVWRFWCEHPDQHKDTAGPQIQDDVIPPYPDSNPNHVFEIHPLSRLGNLSLLDTFHTIPQAYKTKEAKKAFQYYDSLPCKIVADPAAQTTTLYTAKAEYNYAQFKLRLEEDEQFVTLDGRIVRGTALDLAGKEVARDRRMVFVKDTAPEKAVRALKKGDVLNVLGIPRIDLAIVSYRTRVADTHPEVLTWYLPYEMIIVGIYQ